MRQQQHIDKKIQKIVDKMLNIKQIFFRFTQIVKAQPSTDNDLIRLSRWISIKSICSRRQAQQIIKLGLVRVDGKRIFQNMLVPYNAKMKAFTQLGIKQQKPITKLWMINKPRDCICTRSDPQGRKTIYQLFPKDHFSQYGHLMTVGRLDYNSQGLLLVTNDSLMKQFLQNPNNDFPRRYEVKVHGRVTPAKMEKMNAPMIIQGQQYGPLKTKIMRELSTNVWLEVQLKTGKNRQIRRILQKCDLQVSKLIRKQYGVFSLKNLQHKQIQQLQIPQFIDRKLKKQRAKMLTGGSDALIEIDIRDKAFELAKRQMSMLRTQENQKIQEKAKQISSAQNEDNSEDDEE